MSSLGSNRVHITIQDTAFDKESTFKQNNWSELEG